MNELTTAATIAVAVAAVVMGVVVVGSAPDNVVGAATCGDLKPKTC